MKTKLFSLLIIMIIMAGGCDLFQNKPPTKIPLLDAQKEVKRLSLHTEQYSDMLDDFIDENLIDVKKNIEKADEIKKNTTTIQEKTEEIKESSIVIDKTVDQIKQKSGESVKTEILVIKEESKNIIKSSDEIKEQTQEIEIKAEEIVTTSEKQKESTEDVAEISSDIKNLAGEIKNVAPMVGKYEDAIKDLEKERNDALKEKEEAEADRDSALHEAIRWLILASIVGAGALGVFGFMYGSRMCLTLSAVCIVIMSIAIFVESYFVYLAIGGGLILASLVGLMIYNIYVQ